MAQQFFALSNAVVQKAIEKKQERWGKQLASHFEKQAAVLRAAFGGPGFLNGRSRTKNERKKAPKKTPEYLYPQDGKIRDHAFQWLTKSGQPTCDYPGCGQARELHASRNLDRMKEKP